MKADKQNKADILKESMTSQSEQLLKKFREKFPSDEWIKGNLYTRSDNMLLYGLDDIEEFFLEALPQVQKESFDRGFEEGKKAGVQELIGKDEEADYWDINQLDFSEIDKEDLRIKNINHWKEVEREKRGICQCKLK
jgi:hypothetical protein